MKFMRSKVEKKQKKQKGKQRMTIELTLLAVPVILYLFIFNYLPMCGIVLAFKEYNYIDGVFKSPWNGWKNFEFFFRSDAAWMTTFNTIFYNFSLIILGAILNAVVALLLNEVKNKLCIKFYQTVMFFPYFLSWVVVSFIVYAYLSSAYGVLNQCMEFMGLEQQNWYQYPKAWRWILIFAGLWKTMGMSVLINYATLIGIDSSYYDAAKVDGANGLQCAWYISVPALIPITVIQFILSMGKIFNSDFGLFYQLPRGSGILSSTTSVIDTYVYEMLMGQNEIGISSAVGLFQAAVGLVLIIITNKIVNKVQPESALF